MNTADQREVASDHEPLNVVTVSSVKHFTNARLHARHVGVAAPIKVWQLAALIKPISICICRALKPIHAAHELAPTNQLTNERLHRLQWRLARVVCGDGLLATLLGIDQLQVQRT